MKLLFWKVHMGMLLVNVQSEQYLLPDYVPSSLF